MVAASSEGEASGKILFDGYRVSLLQGENNSGIGSWQNLSTVNRIKITQLYIRNY